MASSWHDFKTRDIPPIMQEWLKDLAAVQLAAANREKDIEAPDHALMIAKIMIRHGIKVTTSVDRAIEKMQKLQDAGDTIELAILMNALPPQWSLYRIALQDRAEMYFKQNQHEDPKFMTLYFKNITFLTLWNDVWMEYARVQGGGRDLALLAEVAHWLLELEKPSSDEMKIESEAQIRGLPEQAFAFTLTDIQQITETTKLVTVRQMEKQKAIRTEADEKIRITKNHQEWLKQALILTASARIAAENNTIWIEEDNRNTDHLKRSVKDMCDRISKAKHVLIDLKELQNMQMVSEQKSKQSFEKFSALLKDTHWQNVYRDYVKAYSNWAKAYSISELFRKIEQYKPEQDLPQHAETIRKLKEQTYKPLTDKEVTALHGIQLLWKADFEKAQKLVLAEASNRDQYEYTRWVMTECVRLHQTYQKDSTPHIVKYLQDNANPSSAAPSAIERMFNEDNKKEKADDMLYCKATNMLREARNNIRVTIDIELIGSLHHQPNIIVRDSAEACKVIEATITNANNKIKAQLKEHIDEAKRVKFDDPPELQRELFTRQLLALYTNGARKKLHAVFALIQNKEILTGMSDNLITEGQKEVMLPPPFVVDLKRSAESQASGTFGELIRLVLRLMWVLHKEEVTLTKM